MNLLTAPFRQLVERRLWPVAVLLLVALVAVPAVLAKDGDEAVPPAGATATTTPADANGETTLVTAGDPAEAEKRRKVLGSRKDPFRPAHRAKATATATSAPATSGGGSSSGGSSSGGGSSSSGGGSSSAGSAPVSSGGSYGPVTPSVTTPSTPSGSYPVYGLEVAFGGVSGGLDKRVIKRLTGLPGGSRPAVIYIGLMPNHKTAVFVVDRSISVQGDGRCEPSPANCQTLRMNPGDTVFLTRDNGRQYELDLVKVHTRRVASASAAAAIRSAEAAGGRDLLRSRLSQVGRYRFSSRTGTLRLLSSGDWKAEASAAAARAR